MKEKQKTVDEWFDLCGMTLGPLTNSAWILPNELGYLPPEVKKCSFKEFVEMVYSCGINKGIHNKQKELKEALGIR